mmetsp:Transcript_6272/g.17875  ORF Transcript_6272/g.17875 Transcript_6272/m.17875 type:complete len:189 (-) Transcript_6272:148-714(-)
MLMLHCECSTASTWTHATSKFHTTLRGDKGWRSPATQARSTDIRPLKALRQLAPAWHLVLQSCSPWESSQLPNVKWRCALLRHRVSLMAPVTLAALAGQREQQEQRQQSQQRQQEEARHMPAEPLHSLVTSAHQEMTSSASDNGWESSELPTPSTQSLRCAPSPDAVPPPTILGGLKAARSVVADPAT